MKCTCGVEIRESKTGWQIWPPFLAQHAKPTSQGHVTAASNWLDDHPIAEHLPIFKQYLKKNKKKHRHPHSPQKQSLTPHPPTPCSFPTPRTLVRAHARNTTYLRPVPADPTFPYYTRCTYMHIHTIETTNSHLSLHPSIPPHPPTKKKFKKQKRTRSRPRIPRIEPGIPNLGYHTHTHPTPHYLPLHYSWGWW